MILDTGNYYAELREDGTYVKHHCRFAQQGVIAYTCDGTQFVPLPAAELARRIELKKQPERI